ncbi:MAG: conjugal transfer protein [Legionellaceae bacterium]|nr:conjugal transfer protein [Legionellaceae bacterium]|tara:strand:+ start:420 stop:707 length:288 start_codon:yes stop_codon:yes gene_type:complete
MNTSKMSFIALTALTLTGCGTMNSDFSCNATAGDSCLTIEQVDAMTRFADDGALNRSKRNMMKAENSLQSQGAIAKMENGQSVWVARKALVQSWA